MAKDFQQAISDLMMDVGDELKKKMKTSLRRSAQEARKIIRDASPVNKYDSPKRGSYRKGWSYSIEETGNVTTLHAVVHNRTDYQLTHLLENGHWLVRGGPLGDGGHIVRWVNPVPHIAEAQEEVNEMFYNDMVKEISTL